MGKYSVRRPLTYLLSSYLGKHIQTSVSSCHLEAGLPTVGPASATMGRLSVPVNIPSACPHFAASGSVVTRSPTLATAVVAGRRVAYHHSRSWAPMFDNAKNQAINPCMYVYGMYIPFNYLHIDIGPAAANECLLLTYFSPTYCSSAGLISYFAFIQSFHSYIHSFSRCCAHT